MGFWEVEFWVLLAAAAGGLSAVSMADALPCKTADVLRRGKPGWQISAGVRRTRVVNQRRGAVTEIS